MSSLLKQGSYWWEYIVSSNIVWFKQTDGIITKSSLLGMEERCGAGID